MTRQVPSFSSSSLTVAAGLLILFILHIPCTAIPTLSKPVNVPVSSHVQAPLSLNHLLQNNMPRSNNAMPMLRKLLARTTSTTRNTLPNCTPAHLDFFYVYDRVGCLVNPRGFEVHVVVSNGCQYEGKELIFCKKDMLGPYTKFLEVRHCMRPLLRECELKKQKKLVKACAEMVFSKCAGEEVLST